MKKLNDIFSIKNKTFIITGSSGQLGAFISNFLIENGAIVIGIDTAKKNSVNFKNFYKVDITKRSSIKKCLDDIFNKFNKIDVVINNAGYSTFDNFEERKEKEFDKVMNVNLKGTFLLIQNYVRLLDKFKMKEGNIINIGSLYGSVSPDPRIYSKGDRKNSEIYGATKAGVIQMTKYFAVHLANRNIRVNSISPGGIFNPDKPQGSMFIENYSRNCPMKRMGENKDIIGAIIYFATKASSYTTGQNLVVDGGLSSW